MTEKKVTIGLVSHDGRKTAMVAWVNHNREGLRRFNLVGTNGTAKAINKVVRLEVKTLGHGPFGGDIRIANSILDKNIDALVFFVDTSEPHGHEHDIQTLIRTCITCKVPFALNVVTADYILRCLLE